jgi:arabinosaccharide transport system substrate-binding protein
VADTVAFYAQMVAGAGNVAAMSSGPSGSFVADLVNGNLCAFITPDWRAGSIKHWAPQLAGKLRMMPLPVFESTDSPTSTWGGTMIGITRASKHPELAWKLIEKLYFSREGLEQRRAQTDILPPVMTLWDDPAYHQPDPFFGNQRVDELYIELARKLPRRYVAPTTVIASAELSAVLSRATAYLETNGPQHLREQCQRWLDLCATDLKMRIKQWSFEP